MPLTRSHYLNARSNGAFWIFSRSNTRSLWTNVFQTMIRNYLNWIQLNAEYTFSMLFARRIYGIKSMRIQNMDRKFLLKCTPREVLCGTNEIATSVSSVPWPIQWFHVECYTQTAPFHCALRSERFC
mmetsp:Transcript_24946/g.37209  ORF Transcript_24946/g.37209 Transcript_24946/m.37209 type:complete len:127 (-) Transcript_24946:1578-1958(-)